MHPSASELTVLTEVRFLHRQTAKPPNPSAVADQGGAPFHISSFFLIFPPPQKYPRLELPAARSKGEGASTGTLLSGAGCALNGFGLQAFL